jgi:predicted transcriptional regulator
MDQVNAGAVHAETDANDARVARLIADAPSGLVVDLGLIDDWLVRLGTDHEQQPPYVQSPNLNEGESEKYRRESAMVAAGLASLAAGRIVDRGAGSAPRAINPRVWRSDSLCVRRSMRAPARHPQALARGIPKQAPWTFATSRS